MKKELRIKYLEREIELSNPEIDEQYIENCEIELTELKQA